MNMSRTITLLLPLIGLLASNPLQAQQTIPRDPWVPPAQRIPSKQAPASGAALQAQAAQKLQREFDAADTGHRGYLTKEQAQAAGLGYVAKHFDKMDLHQTGKVRFKDVQRFMAEHAAQTQ